MRHHLPLLLPIALAVTCCQTAPTATDSPEDIKATSPVTVGAACPERPTLYAVQHRPLPANDQEDEDKLPSSFWLVEGIVELGEEDPFFGKEPDYDFDRKSITAEQASAIGVKPSDEDVYLFAKDGPPCVMKPTDYIAWYGGDGPYYTTVFRKLEGTCERSNESWAYVAARGEGMASCAYKSARADAHEDPTPHLDGMKLPAELATARDPASCVMPECDLQSKYEVSEVGGGVKVHSFITTHIFIEGDEECNWEKEDHYYVLASHAGATPTRLETYFDSYKGALIDAATGAPRVLLTNDLGQWRVYTAPREGTAGAMYQDTTWYIPHEEDHQPISLGPYCGP